MGYVRLALDRVVTDEVTKQDIISELAYLIDTVEAKNAEAYWMQS
jgi:hypothetical protein